MDGLLHTLNVTNLANVCGRTGGHFRHSSKATKILKAAEETECAKAQTGSRRTPLGGLAPNTCLTGSLSKGKQFIWALKGLNMPMDLTTSNCDLMANVVKIK